MEDSKITLERIVVTAEPGTDPTPSAYGFVIDKDGRMHSLIYRWTHGVVVALLYPEVAEKNGVPAPAGPIDELDVFAYQRFEHDVSHDLPIIRVATSQLTNFVGVSKGSFALTNTQIDSVRRALKALNRGLRDTLSGEDEDSTVAELLDNFRAEQEAARNLDDAKGDA